MADADEKPIVSIDPQYLLAGDVVERPPDERPKHDTIEAILDWLAGPAQQIPSLSGARPNAGHARMLNWKNRKQAGRR